MVKELKVVYEKYNTISQKSEYVSVHQVVGDLYSLIMEARLKRIPKRDR